MRPSRSRFARVAGVAALAALVASCDLAVSLNNLEGGCPPTRGPAQVKLTSSAGNYCIDTTEVTNGQYASFVGASSFAPTFPSSTGCASAFTTDGGAAGPFTPTPLAHWPPPSGEDDFPVTNVSWCQAYAFCQWAGKRLCGRIGGTALATVSYLDPSQAQWLRACSGGQSPDRYPYGTTYDAQTCGGQALNGSTLQPVTYYSACVGGYPGLRDMSGNVWEWVDSCADPNPDAAHAFCSAMGGAFDSQASEMQCSGQRNWVRADGANNIGFRCCLDL
jgi:formylglycine-generating enzyme required for sulfatase activity